MPDDFRQSPSIIPLLGVACLCLGAFGLFGVWAYFQEPASNNSRYQILAIPVLAMILGCPAAIMTFVLYMVSKSPIGLVGNWLVVVGCITPVLCLIGFAAAAILS